MYLFLTDQITRSQTKVEDDIQDLEKMSFFLTFLESIRFNVYQS